MDGHHLAAVQRVIQLIKKKKPRLKAENLHVNTKSETPLWWCADTKLHKQSNCMKSNKINMPYTLIQIK